MLVFKFRAYFPGVKYLCLPCSLGSGSIFLVSRLCVFPGIQVLCMFSLSPGYVYIFMLSRFCVYISGLLILCVVVPWSLCSVFIFLVFKFYVFFPGLELQILFPVPWSVHFVSISPFSVFYINFPGYCLFFFSL